MARMADVRSQYENDSVVTSPERLITMLYDRLLRDLREAEDAIEAGARLSAGDSLIHAQAIVFELLSALDFSVGSVATNLGNLYTWLIPVLVKANTQQDVNFVRHARNLVEPLASAWHLAAAEATPAHFGAAV